MINTMTKSNLGGIVSACMFQLQVMAKGSQGRNSRQNLEVGAGVDAVEKLTGLLPIACASCFLRAPRTTCPDVGAESSHLGPPAQMWKLGLST